MERAQRKHCCKLETFSSGIGFVKPTSVEVPFSYFGGDKYKYKIKDI